MENSMKHKMQTLLNMDCCDANLRDNALRFGLGSSAVDNETAMLAGLLAAASSGSIPAIREVRSILGIDDSAERLALKKQELDLKKHHGSDNDNTVINAWIEAVTDDDPQCVHD